MIQASTPGPREPVVLVHGLWMIGHEFRVLRHRLQVHHGFDAQVFTYPSLQGDADEIGTELAAFAERCARQGGSGRVHVVAHSLGGAIAWRALERGLEALPGHTVVMAAPLNGCLAARGAVKLAMLRSLLGPLVLHELAEGCERRWTPAGPRTLGAIAGTRPVGLGQFFARFDEENDGTVAVRETVIPGLTDHLVLPHSHIGMLFAHDVADQVAHFLRHGRFEH